MITARNGEGANGSAVIATKPPNAPLSIITTSVLPVTNLEITAQAITPAPAAKLVLMYIVATAVTSSNVPIANCDPPLNPNHPSHRINTPRVARGIEEFAGSTLVHSAGAAAALAGAILLGPRLGRFTDSGEAAPMEPFANSSIPLATLGVFILWLGWFGFNGGSQLAMGTFDDVTAVATIYINTNLAAGAGVMACAVISRLVTGKTDVVMMLNGALGGLVAITAEPLAPSPFLAVIIGAIGGLIVFYGTRLLISLKIDDVVGAIPVHGFAGIFGTLVVPISNTAASFGAQLYGIIAINVFVFVVSFIIWYIMKMLFGIRISEEAEKLGTDKSEVGVMAYSIRD